MNNQGKTTFFLRHTEDTKRAGDHKAYEEDFYLNLRHSFSIPNQLHFFAYGECLWRNRHQYIYNNLRSWWAFELVTEGDGIFICDNIRYDLCPGDLCIIRPDKIISLRTGPSGIFRKKCVLLEGNLDNYICKDLQIINVIRAKNPQWLKNIYVEIKQFILAQEEFVQDELDIQAYTLLVKLNRLAMPPQYPLPLCRALNLIGANLRFKYTLNSLSLECKVSVSTLSTLFQRHLNISPINYIINRRLEYASQLLKISNMPLKEIAERCGYKSESFLSRSFKKKFGVTPASCRRS